MQPFGSLCLFNKAPNKEYVDSRCDHESKATLFPRYQHAKDESVSMRKLPFILRGHLMQPTDSDMEFVRRIDPQSTYGSSRGAASPGCALQRTCRIYVVISTTGFARVVKGPKCLLTRHCFSFSGTEIRFGVLDEVLKIVPVVC